MAVPGGNWQQQILGGINAPVTPQNMRALNAWAQAEGGGATNNPFNTTQMMPGATPYNTLDSGGHVYNYQTPQQGINATIQTLQGQIGNYGPIRSALQQGTNPMAVAQAIAGSQWGTGRGVINVLGGSAGPPSPSGPISSSMPPGQAAVPGASPRLPQVNQPPAPGMDPTALRVLGGLQSGNLLGGLMGTSQPLGGFAGLAGLASLPSALPSALPSSTPGAQASTKSVKSGQTANGMSFEVQGSATPRALQAVKGVENFLGTPYQWGGESPKGFDCSGLLQYVWGKRGVEIPRTTYDQFQAGAPVTKGKLAPGDAVFFTGSDPKGGLPGHVGMYIGGGKFVEAPHTGATVRVSNLAGRSDFVGARRYG